MKLIKKLLVVFLIITTMTIEMVYAKTIDNNNNFNPDDRILNSVQLLKIINGNISGNIYLNNNIKRSEFCKMIIKASNYKDKITNSNVSVFNDVLNNHWANNYINQCVKNGWICGFLDGSFKPDKEMKFEEVATTVLKVLGYTQKDFIGFYPKAQIDLFNSLGINSNLNLQEGKIITKRDCVEILFNMFNSKTKDNQIYAQTLGYELDKNNKLDYNKLLFKSLKGPYVIGKYNLNDIGDFSNYKIYKNDKISKYSDINMYDVVYYNKEIKTVWVYDNKIIGRVDNILPNKINPQKLVLSGNEYTLSNNAILTASSESDLNLGENVVLLKGIDGSIIDIVRGKELKDRQCGIVTNITKGVNDKNVNEIINTIDITFFNNSSGKYNITNSTVKTGDIVQVYYNKELVEVKKIRYNENYDKYRLSKYVKVIDVNKNGLYKIIPSSRLSLNEIKSKDVLYYSLDNNNKIDSIVLDNCTGDLYKYGIVTKVDEVDSKDKEGKSIFYSKYEYMINDKYYKVGYDKKLLCIHTGPCRIISINEEVLGLRNLKKYNVTSVGYMNVTSENKKLDIADDVKVYRLKNGKYYLVNSNEVKKLDKYKLSAYVDSGFSQGGLVRIIIINN